MVVSPGLRDVRRGLPVGDGDLPAGHPAGRGAVAGRGVPRRLRLGAPARVAGRHRRASCGPGSRRAGHHLLGRAWPPRVAVAKLASRRAKPDGVRRRPASAVTTRSCTRSTSASCGGWGRRPPSCCTGSGCGPSATSRTPRWPRCSGRSGRPPAPHLHQLAWGEDRRVVTARRGADDEPDKSIGADETFGRDTDDPEVVLRELLRLSAKVAAPDAGRPGGRPDGHAARCGSPTSPRSPAPGPGRRPPT